MAKERYEAPCEQSKQKILMVWELAWENNCWSQIFSKLQENWSKVGSQKSKARQQEGWPQTDLFLE